MTTFVLDNSVSMRWFFDAGDHPQADALLHDLASGRAEAVVPLIWRYEVCSVLSRAQLRSDISSERVDQFIEDLNALPIRSDDESADRILTDVRRAAITYKLTGYDAAYLELAMRRKLPLATFDEDIRRAYSTPGLTTVLPETF